VTDNTKLCQKWWICADWFIYFYHVVFFPRSKYIWLRRLT